jgi:hypothetical protein
MKVGRASTRGESVMLSRRGVGCRGRGEDVGRHPGHPALAGSLWLKSLAGCTFPASPSSDSCQEGLTFTKS